MGGARPKSLLERWLEAGDGGDFDAFDRYLHQDVVVHAPLGLSSRGIEAEKGVWRDALAAMPDLRHDVQDVLRSENAMAARVVVTGTLVEAFAGVEPTGTPFTARPGRVGIAPGRQGDRGMRDRGCRRAPS